MQAQTAYYTTHTADKANPNSILHYTHGRQSKLKQHITLHTRQTKQAQTAYYTTHTADKASPNSIEVRTDVNPFITNDIEAKSLSFIYTCVARGVQCGLITLRLTLASVPIRHNACVKRSRSWTKRLSNPFINNNNNVKPTGLGGG